MTRFVFALFVLFLLNCSAKEVHFELSNDPNYPQLVAISNMNYHMMMNKYIDFSATVTIYEEINDGTNVNSVLAFQLCRIVRVYRQLILIIFCFV